MGAKKKDALKMASEWLADPLLRDMRGGFTEQVIRQLTVELIIERERNNSEEDTF